MEHFYKDIYGFFDYEDLYEFIVKSLPNNSHVVEIGAFKGCSTAHLAVEIINSGKNIRLDVIDSWDGSDGTSKEPWADYVADLSLGENKPHGDIFEEFKKNLQPVWHVVNPIQALSAPSADLYKDGSLDFVFIDANHTYEGVNEDITKWRPKVKPGGFMAGHDYRKRAHWGVIRAVDEFFGKKYITVLNHCWFIKL